MAVVKQEKKKMATQLRRMASKLEDIATDIEDGTHTILLAAPESTVDEEGDELTIYRVDFTGMIDYGIRVVGKDDVELLASWLGVEGSFDDEGDE
jgi:hypothetical protein